MSNLSKTFPPNRIAALSAFLTGLAAAILAVTDSFPNNWKQVVVASAGILGSTGAALHFMLGSQKMDQHASDEAIADKNLLAAQASASAGADQPTVSENVTGQNVTDVTGVPDDTEAPDDVSPDEIAVPEDLNHDEWLANRAPSDSTTRKPVVSSRKK